MDSAIVRALPFACLLALTGCGDDDSGQSSPGSACQLRFEQEGLSAPQNLDSLLSLRLESPETVVPHKNDTHTEPGVDAVVYKVPEGGTLRIRNDHSDSVTLRLFDPSGSIIGSAAQGSEVEAGNLAAGLYTLEMRNTGEDVPLFLVPDGCPIAQQGSSAAKASSGITATTIAPVSRQTYHDDLITVEQTIKQVTNTYVFQANNARTWAAVVDTLKQALAALQVQGVILGPGGSDSYTVSCGLGTTMTGEDILNGIMNVAVSAALIRPGQFTEFAVQQLMQTS